MLLATPPSPTGSWQTANPAIRRCHEKQVALRRRITGSRQRAARGARATGSRTISRRVLAPPPASMQTVVWLALIPEGKMKHRPLRLFLGLCAVVAAAGIGQFIPHASAAAAACQTF